MNTKKILISLLGRSNSGKSTTWYKLFGQENLNTGKKLRALELIENGHTWVFLVNASPQERCMKIQDIIPTDLEANIVLCSIQYPSVMQDPHVDNCGAVDNSYLKTYQYFERNGYKIVSFYLDSGVDNLNAEQWHQQKGWKFINCKVLDSDINAGLIKEHLIEFICPKNNF